MLITDRQKEILWAVIEEHIHLADPISSKALSVKKDFKIGAPMIRKEMRQLEKEGYLASPHTSAGRIPTDKAYRLYIQENLDSKSNKTSNVPGLTPKESKKIREYLKKDWSDGQSLLKEISRLASEISSELSVSGTLGGESTFTFGFSNLFEEPEFRVFSNMNRLMRFMDNIDRCFDELWQKSMLESLSVLIGEENPIKEINGFTLITGKYRLPAGESGFISVVGPKRMNYRRNIALVEHISKCVEDI